MDELTKLFGQFAKVAPVDPGKPGQQKSGRPSPMAAVLADGRVVHLRTHRRRD